MDKISIALPSDAVVQILQETIAAHLPTLTLKIMSVHKHTGEHYCAAHSDSHLDFYKLGILVSEIMLFVEQNGDPSV
jgi:hypothetical protein